MRHTQKFGDRKTGTNEISLTAEARAPSILAGVFYERDKTDAYAIAVKLVTQAFGEFTLDAQASLTAKFYNYLSRVTLEKGDKITFSTSGAVAGEDHAALIVLEEGEIAS